MSQDPRSDERPYADLTSQEQAERRRAAARKAAATRARKRKERDAERQRQQSGATVAHESSAPHAAAQPPASGHVPEHRAPQPASPSQPPPPQAAHMLPGPAPAQSPPTQSPPAQSPPAQPMPAQSAPPAQSPPAQPMPAQPAPPVPSPPVPSPPVQSPVAPASSAPEDAQEPAVASAGELDLDAPALDITTITKRFGSTVAVDAVTLEVQPGQSFGIVGPNGAGKTTTILVATGLLRPDEGTVRVCGVDLWRARTRAQRMLGVLPDRLRVFDRLTGRQLLVHAALLRKVRRSDAIERAQSLLDALGLAEDADRIVADYSIGMQKTIAIASALMHTPRVIVLDEPFESIDPASTDRILSVLDGYRAKGGTVVLSSHDMALVQRACDHVAVIQHGKLLAVGAMEQVRGGQSLERRFAQLVGSSGESEELAWLSPSRD